MVKMAVQVEVLKDKENSTTINVPKNVAYNASCRTNETEELIVFWGNNSVTFGFFKNSSDSKYEVRFVNATILLPGANVTTNYYHIEPAFQVSDKQSYRCARDQPLNLTDLHLNTSTLAKLHISHLQYQAFVNTTEDHYASAWDCDGANTPDIVPVVVGCILAVLVVLVLVAYLFGRRRCQARGYLSM